MSEPAFADKPDCVGFWWFEYWSKPLSVKFGDGYGYVIMAGDLMKLDSIRAGRWFGPIAKPEFP